MEELFNRPILDQLYDSISEDFEAMLVKQCDTNGQFSKSIKIEEELTNCIKKIVSQKENQDKILKKMNEFELAIGTEIDLLCRQYYKLGIVDSKKILIEIGE